MRLAVLLVLRSWLGLFGLPLQHATRQAAERCFPEAGRCISGRFRDYWERNGALPVFGFAITGAADELNRDTNQRYPTQWFERNRFELHAENAAPYTLLPGRLSDDRLRQQGVDWQARPKSSPQAPHYLRKLVTPLRLSRFGSSGEVMVMSWATVASASAKA